MRAKRGEKSSFVARDKKLLEGRPKNKRLKAKSAKAGEL